MTAKSGMSREAWSSWSHGCDDRVTHLTSMKILFYSLKVINLYSKDYIEYLDCFDEYNSYYISANIELRFVITFVFYD